MFPRAFCHTLVILMNYNPVAMSSTSFPTDLDLAKLHMLEARRALDEFEATHGYGGSVEHQRLEKEFSKATEAYLRLLEEAR